MCHVRNISNLLDLTWLRGFQSKLLIFGVVFFVSKSLLGIERQKRIKKCLKSSKMAILTRKPRSHVGILIYHTWPIGFTLDESLSTLCWGWGGVCKRAECPKTFDQDCSSLVKAFRKINNPVHFTLSYVTPLNSVFVVQSILFFFSCACALSRIKFDRMCKKRPLCALLFELSTITESFWNSSRISHAKSAYASLASLFSKGNSLSESILRISKQFRGLHIINFIY